MIYTVKTVSPDTREWSSKQGGTFVSYTISLEDSNGVTAHGVEWSRKPTSRAPQEGERVAGHIEEGQYGEKFKMDYEATKELGQGGSSGASSSAPASSGSSKGSWQRESERDPERAARILRQHSQEMALRWASLVVEGDDDARRNLTLAKVFQFADAFDQDVNEAGQAASQGAGASAPSNDAQASSPAAAPAPEKSPADTAQWFTKLLEDAAMDAVAALELGKYIAHKFSDDQRKRAESGLRELDRQRETVKALTSAYEKSEGKLLPLPMDGEDDIPF